MCALGPKSGVEAGCKSRNNCSDRPLIDPFLKQYKGKKRKMKIAKVVVDGEQADVTKPAAAFVRHKDRAVSMHLVRLGDQVS